MYFRITWKTHLVCVLISLVIALMLDALIDVIVLELFDAKILTLPTGNAGVNFLLIVLIIMVPVSIFHEIIHGFFYKLFGGRVKLGFKGIYAYCMEVSGVPISRVKFLIVLLAPLTIISITSVLIGGWLGGMFFLLNTLGASGDLLMAFILIRYDSSCSIIDRENGFDVVG